jgi:hypothetical protein
MSVRVEGGTESNEITSCDGGVDWPIRHIILRPDGVLRRRHGSRHSRMVRGVEMDVLVVRLLETEKETLGRLFVFDGPRLLFQCVTLELPWRDNNRRVSRIPEGEYPFEVRKTARHGTHLHIQNVQNRDWILIHSGNYHTHTLGCVLVGNDFADLNDDGELDVTSSKRTMAKLMKVIGGNDGTMKVVDLV